MSSYPHHERFRTHGVLSEWSPLIAEFDSLLSQLECARVALLLAARWFQVNLDDKQEPPVPPSKLDLAAMLENCKQALNQITEKGNL